MMEAICSSETSALTRDTRHNIPEGGTPNRKHNASPLDTKINSLILFLEATAVLSENQNTQLKISKGSLRSIHLRVIPFGNYRPGSSLPLIKKFSKTEKKL
jgi:hypothetical protein